MIYYTADEDTASLIYLYMHLTNLFSVKIKALSEVFFFIKQHVWLITVLH